MIFESFLLFFGPFGALLQDVQLKICHDESGWQGFECTNNNVTKCVTDWCHIDDIFGSTATCDETGEPALYSYRKIENSETIMIGEKKEYMPLSRKAYISKIRKK